MITKAELESVGLIELLKEGNYHFGHFGKLGYFAWGNRCAHPHHDTYFRVFLRSEPMEPGNDGVMCQTIEEVIEAIQANKYYENLKSLKNSTSPIVWDTPDKQLR